MANPTRGAAGNYEMSQSQVAESLFLKQQTICKIEKSAMENFKKIFEQYGMDYKDLLGD